MDVERALRQATALPSSRVALPVAVGIGTAALILGLGILLR
jgi:hypothetical protein